MKVYKCLKCNNIIIELKEGHNLSCCNEPMVELKPNTAEAATEKHLPFCTVSDGVVEVKVGETIHPMDEDHYIEFIVAEYKDSLLKYDFVPGTDPIAYFDYEEDMKIYAYCNKHGLWMTKL